MSNESAIAEHRKSIIAALRRGEDVPFEVLEAYPDINDWAGLQAKLLAEIGGETPAPVHLDQTKAEPQNASPTVDALLEHGLRAGLVISEEIRKKVVAAVKKKFSLDGEPTPQP